MSHNNVKNSEDKNINLKNWNMEILIVIQTVHIWSVFKWPIIAVHIWSVCTMPIIAVHIWSVCTMPIIAVHVWSMCTLTSIALHIIANYCCTHLDCVNCQ